MSTFRLGSGGQARGQGPENNIGVVGVLSPEALNDAFPVGEEIDPDTFDRARRLEGAVGSGDYSTVRAIIKETLLAKPK